VHLSVQFNLEGALSMHLQYDTWGKPKHLWARGNGGL